MNGWRADAACLGDDISLWFVEAHSGASYDTARRVCDGCPVRAECLDYARREGIRFGMWGGVVLGRPGQEARRARREAQGVLL